MSREPKEYLRKLIYDESYSAASSYMEFCAWMMNEIRNNYDLLSDKYLFLNLSFSKTENVRITSGAELTAYSGIVAYFRKLKMTSEFVQIYPEQGRLAFCISTPDFAAYYGVAKNQNEVKFTLIDYVNRVEEAKRNPTLQGYFSKYYSDYKKAS